MLFERGLVRLSNYLFNELNNNSNGHGSGYYFIKYNGNGSGIGKTILKPWTNKRVARSYPISWLIRGFKCLGNMD